MADFRLHVVGNPRFDLVLRPANVDCLVSGPCKHNRRTANTILAEVFGKSNNPDTVAAQWLSQYQRNNGQAMRDLVNFILRCAGTDLEVDNDEVADVDNAPDRITDLQALYQAEGITE